MEKIDFGTPMNCPRCKHWCIDLIWHLVKRGVLKYQCKDCGFIFQKEDRWEGQSENEGI